MSIGEVLARLRPEFPDITISKLRFLEAEGLVEPLRAPSGYRKYTPAHLERLRYVLAAQRDRYLPLRVIREQIEAQDRGERVVGLPPVPPAPRAEASARSTAPRSAASGPTSEGSGASGASREDGDWRGAGPARAEASARSTELGDSRLTRAQLSERSGLDEAGIVDLEQYGLLTANPNGFYSTEALTVARVAARLAEYGLEGRHLRPYRTTADREVGLLAQLVPVLARQAGPGGREQALETVHELAALCAQLHGALVRQGLRQVLGP
jgi:DNA-binding transcriptional MerR regulator